MICISANRLRCIFRLLLLGQVVTFRTISRDHITRNHPSGRSRKVTDPVPTDGIRP